MENIIVGVVIVGALAYLFVKGKSMVHPGGSCGG